jgi:hypothetical protein
VGVTGGTAPYNYFWTPPVSDPDSLTMGWYYLCVTDDHGCQDCDSAFVDEVIGVFETQGGQQLLSVHPNPVLDKAVVMFPSGAGWDLAEVALHDLAGQVVWKKIADANRGRAVAIERGNLPPGLYLLSARRGDGVSAYGKVVVK